MAEQKDVEEFRSNGIHSGPCNAHNNLPVRTPPRRSHPENICVTGSFTLQTEGVSYIGKLTFVEDLMQSVWTANSGSSCQMTPNERGVFDFRPLKNGTIGTAGGKDATVEAVRKVSSIFHSGEEAFSVALDDILAIPGCRCLIEGL